MQRLREQGIANLAVLDRIRNVPRHIFVDEALGSRAYEDTALPIGFGQTISQPYIVARMTEALLEGGAVDNGKLFFPKEESRWLCCAKINIIEQKKKKGLIAKVCHGNL